MIRSEIMSELESELESPRAAPKKKGFLPGRVLRSLWIVVFAIYLVALLLSLYGDVAKSRGRGTAQPQAINP